MTPIFYLADWLYALSILAMVVITAGGYRLRMMQKKIRQMEMVGRLQARIDSQKTLIQQLEQMNQNLQRLSCVDGLTGIANRRHFEEVLDLEWRRACRVGTPLSLVMIDADFFKAFNDAYGHQRGDECLILIANTLRDALSRPGDLVARYGGEEFMILLPRTDAEGSRNLAEAIRIRVEALEIRREGSSADKVVTISSGVGTCYPTQGISPNSLVAEADGALYRAKAEGRNKVVSSAEVLRGLRKRSAPANSHSRE